MSAQVTEAAPEALGLTGDDLLAMYRAMLTARLIDEAALRQNRMGRAPFVVPVSGHEGCQIGTGWALRPGTDVWVPYYRDLGIVLRAGLTPYEFFLGLFSKADDPSSGGRQMPNHWGSRRLKILSHSSPIATQVPHAAGIAYAARYRGDDVVVGCWFGEGATSEGDWHEGVNFAAIHRLPVIFVCENNEYAISVHQTKQMAVRDVATRADGYGIPGRVVDGSDVLACYAAMREAHDRARAGEGPTLVECKTYRFLPHTSDDDDKTYRSREEVEEHRHHDALIRFGALLRERGILDDAGAEELRDQLKDEIDAAIQAAWDAPDPDPQTALRHVFAEDGP
ncbi:MAG TPA: thiamine pyrophosphate-dependent dehydrogenase E1 component subunit alpha [Actinomycetota bacterium]|jgi:2-oxoisovalerate dehydrogenase E1 component alpha subunit